MKFLLPGFTLNDEQDSIVWCWSTDGTFSSKSVYSFLANTGVFCALWSILKERNARVFSSTARDRTILLGVINSWGKGLVPSVLISCLTFSFFSVYFAAVPLNIRVCHWLVRRGRILTKDVLSNKRGWNGDMKCMFCENTETLDHLFINCSFIRQLWNWIVNFHGF